MNLRAHQAAFSEVIDGIIAGSGVRNIIVSATPGSGKSLLPVIAGRLIAAGFADKLAWICPRKSLQDQGERNFTDPLAREMTGVRLTIRSSTNDADPCRGCDGWISTFQALGVDYNQTVLREFKRRRYILIIDEGHHCDADDGSWMKSIEPLYQEAAYTVIMSGTMSRHSGGKIAFIPYTETGEDEFRPCFENSPDTVFIEYGRTDALADKAIIPLSFKLHDGQAKWQNKEGKDREARISTTSGLASEALFTALHTGFARELLETAIDHWQHYRESHRSSKLLVVAANIKVTKEYQEFLKSQGLSTAIATSDDDKAAAEAIKKFKAGKIDVLTSCQVAYEGLDCPAISHIACLTNIRSMEWITQMCGRAVRIDPLAGPYESQRGFIFAPADRMFTELATKIEADQCQAVAKAKVEKEKREEFCLDGGPARPGITPLSSRMLNAQRQHIFHYEDTAEPIRTQREIETELREEIDKKVKSFCRIYNVKPAHLNAELKRQFGKCRADMSVPELEKLTRWINQKYPVSNRIV